MALQEVVTDLMARISQRFDQQRVVQGAMVNRRPRERVYGECALVQGDCGAVGERRQAVESVDIPIAFVESARPVSRARLGSAAPAPTLAAGISSSPARKTTRSASRPVLSQSSGLTALSGPPSTNRSTCGWLYQGLQAGNVRHREERLLEGIGNPPGLVEQRRCVGGHGAILRQRWRDCGAFR